MLSDADIIEAVLGGDVDQYAELVKRYQTTSWKLAYSFVGNFEDAKELSQNGFIKAYRHLAQFRGRAKFSTWLYRIIVNECKDFFKQRARQPRAVSITVDSEHDDELPFEVTDPHGTPGDAAVNRELGRHLQVAIEGLSGRQRTAFVLHHLNGLSLEEIAQLMGCRVGTVKSHLFRACEQLRTRLAPYTTVSRSEVG